MVLGPQEKSMIYKHPSRMEHLLPYSPIVFQLWAQTVLAL